MIALWVLWHSFWHGMTTEGQENICGCGRRFPNGGVPYDHFPAKPR